MSYVIARSVPNSPQSRICATTYHNGPTRYHLETRRGVSFKLGKNTFQTCYSFFDLYEVTKAVKKNPFRYCQQIRLEIDEKWAPNDDSAPGCALTTATATAGIPTPAANDTKSTEDDDSDTESLHASSHWDEGDEVTDTEDNEEDEDTDTEGHDDEEFEGDEYNEEETGVKENEGYPTSEEV